MEIVILVVEVRIPSHPVHQIHTTLYFCFNNIKEFVCQEKVSLRCELVWQLTDGVRLQNVHEARKAKRVVLKRAKFCVAATGDHFEMQTS